MPYSDIEWRKQYQREWRRANPEKLALYQRRASLKRRYGLSLEDYDQILQRQNVDHDHKSGRVRGILCSEHNLGLGKFNDDPILLKRALDYLG